jgi:hypothetical protein
MVTIFCTRVFFLQHILNDGVLFCGQQSHKSKMF